MTRETATRVNDMRVTAATQGQLLQDGSGRVVVQKLLEVGGDLLAAEDTHILACMAVEERPTKWGAMLGSCMNKVWKN